MVERSSKKPPPTFREFVTDGRIGDPRFAKEVAAAGEAMLEEQAAHTEQLLGIRPAGERGTFRQFVTDGRISDPEFARGVAAAGEEILRQSLTDTYRALGRPMPKRTQQPNS
jgi:hypothetical protein